MDRKKSTTQNRAIPPAAYREEALDRLDPPATDHQRWVASWLLKHSDLHHPPCRDTCHHCQLMIEIYGEMPRLDEMEHVRALLQRVERSRPAKTSIPDNLRWEVFERDDFTCQICSTRKKLTVDHIHPESQGGTLALDNLQTLCRSCNSRKWAHFE